MENHRSIFALICCCLLLFGFAVSGFSQRKVEVETRRPPAPESANRLPEAQLPPLESPKEPINCAIAGRYFDDAIARVARERDEFLVVIIRAGRGESSGRLNEIRSLRAKAYLEYTRFPRYVVAKSEAVGDYGHIELYVSGKRLYVLPLKRNRGLDLLSCVAP